MLTQRFLRFNICKGDTGYFYFVFLVTNNRRVYRKSGTFLVFDILAGSPAMFVWIKIKHFPIANQVVVVPECNYSIEPRET